MELRHLRYFVAAAEEQNITRAAQRLHVSQPPLSRQIRDLEHELGVALFERSARAVRLTDAGRVFLDEARAALAHVEAAVRAVRSAGRGETGEIHVGYAPSLTVELLPVALREFQARRPGVQVRLHDLSTEEMLAGLRDGTLHAALLIEPPAAAARRLHVELLRTYPVCVALAPGHPLARSRSVSLARLAQEKFVGYSRTGYPEYHAWLTGLLATVGMRLRFVAEFDGVSSLVAGIEAGRGVAILPSVVSCIAGPRLKLRKIVPALEPARVALALALPLPAGVAGEFAAVVRAAAKANP